MKLKAQEGTTSANVGGQEFTVGEDGCIDVPDEGNYLPLLQPHGFTVFVPDSEEAPAKPAQPQLQQKLQQQAQQQKNGKK